MSSKSFKELFRNAEVKNKGRARSRPGASGTPVENVNNVRRNYTIAFKNLMNDKTFKRIVRVGTESFDAIKKYNANPGVIEGIWCGFEIVKSVTEDIESWSFDYFNVSEWSPIFSSFFYESVYSIINKHQHYVVTTPDDDRTIQVFDVDGHDIGVYFNPSNNTVIGMYARIAQRADVTEFIRASLWDRYKDQNVVIVSKKVPGYDTNVITFAVDSSTDAIPSEEATQHAAYLRKCIDAGVNRSLLFIGSPGTGKSTMVQAIIHNLGLRSFRIRVDQLSSFENEMVSDSVETFKPDAIVIDDFDRTHDQISMLQILEQLKKSVKLIMLTVNDKERLDAAILRPGRIDEFVFVEKLNEKAVKTILGDEHAHVFEQVKNWPVAFINEYINRRRFMTSDEALVAMKELSQRVKSIRHKSMRDVEDTFEAQILGISEDDDNDDDLIDVPLKKKPRKRKPKSVYNVSRDDCEIEGW